MRGKLAVVPPDAILPAATSSASRQLPATFPASRQLLAEPLWFAIMSRALWGANAAKELQFITTRSERTCRAWASGDSEPPASVLVALLFSGHADAVLKYILADASSEWWREHERALRIARLVDAMDRS
jgi:hypothetical protein